MNQQPIGQFCWNELATHDMDKAKNFYSTVLNWNFKDNILDDGSVYTVIRANGQDIGGIWQAPEDLQNPIQPYWLPYLFVLNVAETLEKAKQNGAKEIKGVTTGTMGKFAVIMDPTGVKVAFWEAP